jgi:hypothetical protein
MTLSVGLYDRINERIQTPFLVIIGFLSICFLLKVNSNHEDGVEIIINMKNLPSFVVLWKTFFHSLEVLG